MEPIAFELEQTVMLPDHDLVTYTKDQPQYRPLPVAKIHGPEGRVISRWTLTAEERTAIAAGEDLYLEQLTFGNPLQPILPTVGLREQCPADPVPIAGPYEEEVKEKALRSIELLKKEIDFEKLERASRKVQDGDFPLKYTKG